MSWKIQSQFGKVAWSEIKKEPLEMEVRRVVKEMKRMCCVTKNISLERNILSFG